MALIHRATLRPGKAELLANWLAAQPWGPGDAADLERVGAYRFEDPAGRVGLETHLVRVAGEVWQVALTYRDAPLPDAEAAEVGRMHHSVLGERWVYDGCADLAYVRMLAATALTGCRSVRRSLMEEDGTIPGAATDCPALWRRLDRGADRHRRFRVTGEERGRRRAPSKQRPRTPLLSPARVGIGHRGDPPYAIRGNLGRAERAATTCRRVERSVGGGDSGRVDVSRPRTGGATPRAGNESQGSETADTFGEERRRLQAIGIGE